MSTPRLSITQMQADLQAKRYSSEELVKQSYSTIQAASKLGPVFLSQRQTAALADAKASDARRRDGKTLSPLDGIPVAVKDNIVMRGEPCTCASMILRNFTSPYDSDAVGRLKAAGAVIVGKTNLDEFAMGSSNENSAFGCPSNPWDVQRVPGGSSGGSAVAVGSGMVPLSLGSDTGGSVRLPASFCGTVGVKPTYGRVSRYGLVAFASSLDQIGPLSWWVEDSALLLQTLAGHDKRDSTCAAVPVPNYTANLKQNLAGKRFGVPKEYIGDGINDEVRRNFEASLKTLEKLGAKRVEVSLPHTQHAVACYYILASAEASANLSRFDGIRYTERSKTAKTLKEVYLQSRGEGFGAEVKRRIMLGTFVLSSGYYDAYYAKGQRVRTLLRRDFQDAFGNCDFIATPTAPFTAFKKNEKIDDPLQMYLSDIFTTSVNLAGLPALSVPSGFDAQGLPFGLQLIGKAFDEATLFSVAYQFEQTTALRGRLP